MMNEIKINTYIFGDFRLDTRRQRLVRGETVIPLTRKRYEILLLLIENAGKVLHKDEILEKIWPNQAIEESNLTQHIYVLRRLIEDDPRSPDYILTIPGVGYQFSPVVEVVTGSLATSDTSSATGVVPDQHLAMPGVGTPTESHTSLTIGKAILSRLNKGRSVTLSPLNVAGISVLVTVLVISLLFFINRQSNLQNKPLPLISPLLTGPGIKSNLTYSADGKFLAFTSDLESANQPDIYVKIAGTGEPVRITNSADGEFFIAWSPDGLEIAFLRWSPERPSNYQLIITPALGGMERQIAQVDGGLSWSPDGRFFAVTLSEQPDRATGVYLLSVDGQSRQALSVAENHQIFDTMPRFSPDGSQVAFIRWSASSLGDLFIVNTRNRETRQITFDQKNINDIQWSPDGKSIFFSSNRNGNQRLWRIDSTGGTPELINNVPADIANFTISPVNNGHQFIAYTQNISDTTTAVYQLGAENSSVGAKSVEVAGGAKPSCVINSSRRDDSPRWSPDGQQLAFVSNRSGFDDIWITNSTCTGDRQLTSLKSNDIGSPRWSPDGRMIAFDIMNQGQADVMMVEVSTGRIVRMTADLSDDRLPAWSADGQWLYFTSERSGVTQIWRMATEGGNTLQVTSKGGFEPMESPDGKRLFYTKSHFLWQKDLVTGEESQVKELASIPVRRYWHIGANHIYYIPQSSSTQPAVFKLNLSTRVISKEIVICGFTNRFLPGISITAREDMLAASFIGYHFTDVLQIENWW